MFCEPTIRVTYILVAKSKLAGVFASLKSAFTPMAAAPVAA